MRAMAAGITVSDPSQPDNPLVFCNPAFLEMTGYAAEELLGRNCRVLQGPNTDPAAKRAIRDALAEERSVAVEIINYRKDGSTFWNALSIRPIPGPDGRARWFVGSSIDITRQRDTERQLLDAKEQLTKLAAETFALAEDLDRAREQAERAREASDKASQAKSRFLAMMSHELRTPMTAVIGMGDLLMATPLTEQQKGFVKTLRTSAETLLAILNDVLDFSKIEAGQLELESIDFSLYRLVEDVIQLFLVRAAAKGIALCSSIADETPRHIRGDPVRLRQVLFNLVSNAIKFTDRGSVEVMAWSDPGPDGRLTLHFEVTDTGIGMSAPQQQRLFEAFVQADASTARRYGGTGLGLAICKRLVEAMGGSIGVTSTLGRGATFHFSILVEPAHEQPAEDAIGRSPSDAVHEPPSAPVSLRLLLAEDNDVSRMLVTTMLTRMGHQVEGVADGRGVLAALETERYDAVVLDMEMPIMDGQTTARAIRRMEGPSARIPIVGLSADALPEHRDSHLAAGLDAYLTKPVDWSQLGAVLTELAMDPSDRPAVQPRPESLIDPQRFESLSVVDRVKLAELRLALGSETVDGMLRLLPETVRRELAGVRAAHLAGRPREVRLAAHTLAGIAANFGCPRLEAIARAVNADHADPDLVTAWLPVLETAIDETSRQIAEQTPPSAPA